MKAKLTTAVTITLTNDEAVRLRTSAEVDFTWADTTEADLWEDFVNALGEVV